MQKRVRSLRGCPNGFATDATTNMAALSGMFTLSKAPATSGLNMMFIARFVADRDVAEEDGTLNFSSSLVSSVELSSMTDAILDADMYQTVSKVCACTSRYAVLVSLPETISQVHPV